MVTIIAAFVVLIGFFGLIAISTVWGGYILSILWGWFMVPIFHLPVLTISQAIGTMLVIRFITWQHKTDDEKDNSKALKDLCTSFAIAFFLPLISLLIGWIVKGYLPGAQ